MLELSFSNMMEEVIGPNGFSSSRIEEFRDAVSGPHEKFLKKDPGDLVFLDLPNADLSETINMAKQIRETSDAFLILGIGGSALGPRAILESLSPFHNLKQKTKVFIYDNVDPRTMRQILSIIDLKKTTVNVISKSGGTAETAASFMILWDRMKAALGKDAADHFVATTDPVSGTLRKLAIQEGMRTLPIGPEIGGRFSVLTPVGLLLSEVIGADTKELMRGASDMNRQCSTDDLTKNPAYLFGSLLYLMSKEKKRGINVLLPYADSLKFISEWFCQLWGESLGKDGIGMTPYPSVGTTDQHSQLQLWMEGPQDKVITFIKIADYGEDVIVPKVFGEYEGMNYLSGQGLSTLISAEQESSELALAKNGRPNMTITIPRIDAYYLGQLFQFFEIATAFTGFVMNINPFGQPGVEEGKNYTYGMMGKKGYEQKRLEVEAARSKKARWKV